MLMHVYILEHVTHTMRNITCGNPFKECMIGFGQVVEMVTPSHEFKSWGERDFIFLEVYK